MPERVDLVASISEDRQTMTVYAEEPMPDEWDHEPIGIITAAETSRTQRLIWWMAVLLIAETLVLGAVAIVGLR